MNIDEMRKWVIKKYGRIIRGRDVMQMCEYQVLAIYTSMINKAKYSSYGRRIHG